MKKLQRGLTLITALAIVAIFLALALSILDMVTHNGQNIGNAYDKQQYYDVAEAGIDRGLADLDSTLPAPGSTAAPGSPPPTPSGGQTTVPGLPTSVPYTYSFWVNTGSTATSTAVPIPTYLVPSHTVNVPSNGAVIWSYTTANNGRDVAIEEVTAMFHTTTSNCGLCAGTNISVTGSSHSGSASPPPACGPSSSPDKICADPSPSPTSLGYVPLVMGGSYTTSGTCGGKVCAYGDGSGATPAPPPYVTQNAPAASLAGFEMSQSIINQMSDGQAWSTLSGTNPNIKYVSCSSGCGAGNMASGNPKNGPSAGQIWYMDGNVSISGNTPFYYQGEYIINGCFTMGGQQVMNGTSNSSPYPYTASATVIVLGSDASCGGDAFSIAGNAVFNGGTLNVAQGSVAIGGTGNIKYNNFYGDIITAGSVSISGNGNFSYQQGLIAQSSFFGRYSLASFAQY